MQHLLVERGHAGTGYTRYEPKGWAARCRFHHGEDEPLESYREPYRRPQFSENLKPLRRYLAKQVGRPWNTVYGEIRALVNADNAVQFHILQHLYDDLAVTVREHDGDLWYYDGGIPQPLTGGAGRWWWRRPALYVCPRTGLIKRVKRRPAPTRADAVRERLPGSALDQDYRRIAGQWYEVWWGKEPQTGAPLILHKRQLGWKELRDLGLRD